MNTDHSKDRLDELFRAARRARDTRECAAPLGFSTRVAARAFAQQENPLEALFATLSWRALAVCGLLMALTMVSVYGTRSTSAGTSTLDEDGDLQSPVTELVELAS